MLKTRKILQMKIRMMMNKEKIVKKIKILSLMKDMNAMTI
jgi:hypothetical protein